ncbi:MAG TPA: hypothetical protein DCF68_16865, partial [Cyanothece sp. UBA12306]|nr:hypothetical protein [Cyanothece sp. UBA12306]
DYYQLPQLISLDQFKSEGNIRGTLQNPKGLITWQNSGNIKNNNTNFTKQGKILIQKNNLIIRDTVLTIDEGKINFNVSGNLLNKKWQVYISSQSLSLNPFASIICQNIQWKCPDNITLETANIRINGDSNKPGSKGVNLSLNLAVGIDQGNLIINSQLQQNNLKTSITGLEIPVATSLTNFSLPITLKKSRIDLSGNLAKIWQNSKINLDYIQANSTVKLSIAEGTLNTAISLENGLFEGVAKITPLSLNQLLPRLPIPVKLTNSEIEVLGNWRSLLSLGKNPNFNDLQIKTNTQLAIADGTVTAISQLNQGKITINATATPLILSSILPQISTPIVLKETQLDLMGNLEDLIALNFHNFQGKSQLKLEIAKGEVKTSTKLLNNQWTSQILANSIDLSTWDGLLLKSDKLEPINAKINLSGNINNLLLSQSLLPLQANLIYLEMGEQQLNANGNLLISNLWTKPNIQNINLNLDTQADLRTLPVTQILAKLPIKRQLLPEDINLSGTADFQGQLVGKNIFFLPLKQESLQLKGKVKLSDLIINNRIFEPSLSGPIKIATGEQFSIKLSGKEDVIAAIFNRCNKANCLLPYVPENFEIRQSKNNSSPLLVQGKLEDDRLITKVENVPLEFLKIAPISDYGLTDYLGGTINLNLQIDPLTLKGDGSINVLNPSFGKIFGESFTANWVYENEKIILQNATLNLGESLYDVVGILNLKTREIEGKLKINKGYIQDVLTAFKIFDLDSLWRIIQLKKNILADSTEVEIQPIIGSNLPLSEQVNQFWKNEQIIREIAAKRQAGDIPKELDLRGDFSAKFALSGTLQDPEMSLEFEGNRWQWTPQPSSPNIIKSLGFIMEGAQVIPIEKLAITGSLKNGIIEFNPTLKLGSSITKGNLALTYNNNQFYIKNSTFSFENLSLDTVRSLIVIPGDLNGNINLEGSLNGLLTEPEIKGKFEFSDGSIYARLIKDKFIGDFIYDDAQLKVQIKEPDYLKVSANLPFPIVANYNDKFQINTQIENEALSLLETLTQEKLIWLGGTGKIDVNLNGQVLIQDKIKINLDDTTKAILDFDQTIFKTNLLPDNLTLSGKIALQNGRIQIGQLFGQIGEVAIRTTGVLPLFNPVSQDLETIIPLTVAFTQDKVNSAGLYQGIANGKILINGSLLSPKIGGEIRFNQGKILIPEVTPQDTTSPLIEQWIGRISPSKGAIIPPQLDNLRILIDQVTLEQRKISPKFFFNVNGDLSLNGQLNSFSLPGILALKPSGSVQVNRGKIELPVTSVFLSRQYNNTINFLPDKGLLNPYIDLRLKLYILTVSLQTIKDNEITDDIVQSGRSKSVEITLGIQGDANQLLPNLGNQLDNVCNIRANNNLPIPESSAIDPNKLTRIAECIRISNLGGNSIRELLQSPIVSFSSSPRLSNAELITLFSPQLTDVIEQLQQQNSAQLVEAGLPQVALVVFPFLQDWIFDLNETANQKSKENGLGNLRLYPVLETVYELEGDALIRFSYDYSFNEAIIRYENKF